MTFHDKGTGQSIFCSSNSYNAGEMMNKLLAKPAPSIVKPLTLYDGKESGADHLTMIGSSIKYEPAWASKTQKKLMKTLNIKGCIRTLGGN